MTTDKHTRYRELVKQIAELEKEKFFIEINFNVRDKIKAMNPDLMPMLNKIHEQIMGIPYKVFMDKVEVIRAESNMLTYKMEYFFEASTDGQQHFVHFDGEWNSEDDLPDGYWQNLDFITSYDWKLP